MKWSRGDEMVALRGDEMVALRVMKWSRFP
jgi:hypothetical protein